MSLSVGPSLSERYHAATAYTPQSIARHPRLDFNLQPSPFKSWYQARRIALPGGPSTPSRVERGPLDQARLGQLLFHTYGVTLVREFPGMSMHFRASPSAGGLYPTELYVAVRGIDGIPDGILDYHAPDHSLVICWEGDFWRDLERYTFGHPAIERASAVLIGTGVYERSAWRYRDRAYRRVLLDTGHVFGNAIAAAPASGQRVVPVPDFNDLALDGLLLLDEAQEGTLIVGAVIDDSDDLPADVPLLTSPVSRDAHDPEEERWIPVVHAAGRLDEARPAAETPRADPGPEPTGAAVPLEKGELGDGAATLDTIARRRSTRTYEPGPLPLDALGRILAHAYPADGGTPEPRTRLAPGLLDTWIVASSVSGLPPGVFRYDERHHALLPIREGNPRRALFDCTLRQDLGRDCAFAVIHTFDLEAGVARLGERVYRTAHLDAGVIGQRLNLAAIQLGFGVSGIGGFFDEFVGALLMLGPRHAIAYITTIGIST